MKNKIIIFGSNGFVGSSIAEEMSKNNEVVCIIRNKNSCSFLSNKGLNTKVCNSLEYNQVEEVIDNQSIVINCINGDYQTLVKSTRNIALASIKKNVQKLIHLSSTDVYGNSKGIVLEQNNFRGDRGEYSKAKIESEKILIRLQKKIPIIILRPGIIFGPESTLWTNRILERKLNGFNLPNHSKKGICNLTFIYDLVRSICIVSDSYDNSSTFNIINDNPMTWSEYYESFQTTPYKSKIVYKNDFFLKIVVLSQYPIRLIARPILKNFRFIINIFYQKSKYSNNLLKSAQSELKRNPDLNELNLLSAKVSFSNEKSKKILKMNYTSINDALNKTQKWINQSNLIKALHQL